MPARSNHSLKVLSSAWKAALTAADPSLALVGHWPAVLSGRLIIVAAGKAAVPMATAAIQHYQSALVQPGGVVVAPGAPPARLGPLEVHGGGHPLPTEGSVKAGRAVLARLDGLNNNDTVLCLLSGGASALMTVPDGLALKDLRDLNQALLASGAKIAEMNTVRRKLCRLKGGGLARAAAPAKVTALVISDVVGDDPAIIASGPTVSDPDQPAAALEILERYAIDIAAVTARLQELASHAPPEPVQAETTVVASSAVSLAAAAVDLESSGYRAHILTDSLQGDSAQAAGFHAAVARQVLLSGTPFTPPCALLSGGETTVTVSAASENAGAVAKGGRNSHFALALAAELWGQAGVNALIADTDGIDGNSPAAGAFVTPALYATGSLAEARKALAARDSFSYLHSHDHSFITGPTGTNVNDLRIILLEQK